jgi:hypothetical protein
MLASRRRRLVAFLFDHFLFSMLGASAGFAMLGPRWDMAMDFGQSALFPVFIAVMVLYFCKDLIGRANLTVDNKIGLSALEGEFLIFLNQYAGKPVDGRALGDIQNLPLHACKNTEQT